MSQPVASGYQRPSVSEIREDSVPPSSYERREWSPRPFESAERPASRETSLTLAKVTKIAFFAIGAIAVMYLIYAAGHRTGRAEGYDKGYEVGNAFGIIEGKKSGYNLGHIDGKFDGWKDGYADGKKVQLEECERDCIDRINRRCGPRYFG